MLAALDTIAGELTATVFHAAARAIAAREWSHPLRRWVSGSHRLP
jgi:hypothetical protein